MENDRAQDEDFDSDDDAIDNGYDGTGAPVKGEDLNLDQPAVVLGCLREDGRLISADSHGVLVVAKVADEGPGHAP